MEQSQRGSLVNTKWIFLVDPGPFTKNTKYGTWHDYWNSSFTGVLLVQPLSVKFHFKLNFPIMLKCG